MVLYIEQYENLVRALHGDVLWTLVEDILRILVGDVPWHYIEVHMETSIGRLLGTSSGHPQDVILLSGEDQKKIRGLGRLN